MTQTAIELTNSADFWEKRVKQQQRYLWDLHHSNIDHQKLVLLRDSALEILDYCMLKWELSLLFRMSPKEERKYFADFKMKSPVYNYKLQNTKDE